MHPMKLKIDPETSKEVFVRFSLFDRLGFLPMSSYSSEQEISPMASQIGLGPSLFLMSTKALGYFFLLLTILNIPLFLFYNWGYQEEANAITATNIFSRLSIGNIGTDSLTCSETNLFQIEQAKSTSSDAQFLSQFTKANLTCHMGHIGQLKLIGLVESEDYGCNQARRQDKLQI